MNDENLSENESSSEKSYNSAYESVDTEELTEIYLPKTAKLAPFFSLSDANKQRVIELGLCFFKMGERKTQFWNNRDWEKRITQIEKEYQVETEKMTQRIVREQENNNFMKQQFQEQKQLLVDEVRENTEIRYSREIETLKKENNNLQNKISEQNDEYRNLHISLSDKYDEKTAETERKYENRMENVRKQWEEREKQLESKMEKYKSEYENTLVRTQNSTIKGQDGEDFTFHQLNMLFPKAEIQDTHKQTARCDFVMCEKDFKMMLEIKNYKTNVNKGEIDKFYRDVDSEHNNDVQCAILISLKSGVSNKSDFEFEVRNGKPLLFLHKVSENMTNILLAVKFLKMILNQKDIDFTNHEIVGCFKNLASVVKRNFTKQRKQIEKFAAEQTNLISDQETNIVELFKIIKQRY